MKKIILFLMLPFFLFSCENDEPPKQEVSEYELIISAGEINYSGFSVDININAEILQGNDLHGDYKILYGSSESDLSKSIVIETDTSFENYSDKSYNFAELTYGKTYIQVVFDSEILDIKSNVIIVEIKDLSTDDAVDLGLSVLWAKCDLGAENPWEHGIHFVWGDPTGLFGNGCDLSLCGGEIPQLDISGTKMDVAKQLLGDGWRLPTKEEVEELISKCESNKTSLRTVNGYEFVSKSGNSIFLPDDSYYWAGTVDIRTNKAYVMSCFDSPNLYSVIRNDLCYVRPVKDRDYVEGSEAPKKLYIEEKNGKKIVDLGLSVKWAACNLAANSPEESGCYSTWGTINDYPNCSTEGKDLLDISGVREYDRATYMLGDLWRTPTRSEFMELACNCELEEININKIKAVKLTSNINGMSIIFPKYTSKDADPMCLEWGIYWTSTPECTVGDNLDAYVGIFSEVGVGSSQYCRSLGGCIRPVYGEQKQSNLCFYGGHEWVDLGLSVFWATCNVGASSPEEYGNYYAWGEIETKSNYNEGTSKYYDQEIKDWICGNSKYDAATANWGGSWRMPKYAEMRELIRYCNWEWISEKRGYMITSKINGKSIFLRASGCKNNAERIYDINKIGYYWIDYVDKVSNLTGEALYFDRDYIDTTLAYRWGGCSIRPVIDL